MMHKMMAGLVLLITLLVTAKNADGQTQPANSNIVRTDIAVTYDTERSQIANTSCQCFWFQGAGVDAGVTLWRGIGVAADFSGGRASDVTPSVSLAKLNFVAGPRYTRNILRRSSSGRGTSLFAEALFGGVHAYNGLFPTAGALKTSASSFAMQTGGGFNLGLTQHFGIRVVELDYIYSQLPNNATQTQNDFRIATGLWFHFR